MEGYIYIGEHYDLLGRSVNIPDKKIGLSKNPLQREASLNRTKSPIGYRILAAFKVDNMNRVEKMLHSILDSRRTNGEWFRDEEDTLTGEFINFMIHYGAEKVEVSDFKPEVVEEIDNRLKELSVQFGSDTTLIRNYLGVDYEVVLDKNGFLNFMGEKFDTPNKLYNNGIVKYVKGKKGNSGTNNLSQFVIKSTGERLKDLN